MEIDRMISLKTKFIVKYDDKYKCYYVSPDNEDDSIFGDRLPKDEYEAQQCARAANIGYSMAVNELKKKIYTLYNNL